MKTDKIRGNMKIDRHGTAADQLEMRFHCTLDVEQKQKEFVFSIKFIVVGIVVVVVVVVR